ncbi:MAG: type III-A CRISPR-associated RAMP protein Csm4 [Desulfosarcina sp.]|nr:type III-A CRISPR-associated RAMP protein Csm4 [Desulfosarcina sp.]MBC2744360.1 type III-A CRISPR-associated RAMP protein Csm4 [Desulfosarcina sp.]MBC2767269.1 type III-A CRISPR-associated RAMP protein Csm4 [Desulfosarcina sp.]
MELTAYFLDFDAPLHIGLEGIGQESIETTVRSDTLWGAIVQCWSLIFDQSPDKLCVQSPFQVSSCFPFIKGQMFFPLPVGTLDPLMQSEKDLSQIKKLKKVVYLSYPLFCRVLQGEKLNAAALETPLSCWPLLSGEIENERPSASLLNQTKKMGGKFFQTSQRPRLEIDRASGGTVEGQFFYCTDQSFFAESGLFFLGEFENKQTRQHFEAALQLLADSGLGADRSVGRGTFTFRKSTIKFPVISEPDQFCLLSLYHPTREEVSDGVLKHANTAYNVIRRSGQCGSIGVNRFRRADIWMLGEGSVLGVRPAGDISCVLPQKGPIPHNVYRYGVAMAVPMAERRVPK